MVAEFELELRTDRLHLIAATGAISRLAASDRDGLAKVLNACVPSDWPPELLADHLDEFATTLEQKPDQVGLHMWFWIRDDGVGDRVLIGNGGGGGKVDDRGALAIGYAVLDAFQKLGYATEAMSVITGWMQRQPDVRILTADTCPHLKPSIRVMEKLGMTYEGAGPEAGTIRYVRTIG